MNFNISAWSIRRPVPAIVLFLVLVVLGIASFRSMPITRSPNVDIPIVQVTVLQPGTAPAEMETQVTSVIEDAISGVPGVKHQTSTISEGLSVTVIEFRLEINQDRAVNDVKDAVARVRADLPSTIEEPVVQRIDIEGLPIVTYAVSATSMSEEELSWFVTDTVIRSLQGVRNVSHILKIGGAEREFQVGLDPDRLQAYGITAGEVSRQLRATTINLAGGKGEIGGREQTIRTLAGRHSAQELATTAITISNARKVRLDQLGIVRDGIAEPDSFALLDGRPVVAFAVSRSKGASDTAVAAEIAAKVANLKARHAEVDIRLIDSSVDYTVGVYNATMQTLIEGAILAFLVVLVFLRDLRATIIVAIALPLSIIPTFWALSAMGFSLNVVSLLAITIVTGIVVDDAIVEIENIVRHARSGKSAFRAAMEAADEIGLAVVAITFTIIAVFVPVSFMDGVAGQYFKQFGISVAAAVFFSLLVARLVTPVLAAYLMRDMPEVRDEGWLMRAYTRLIAWSVRHRGLTILAGLMTFIVSLSSFAVLPTDFLPEEDTGRVLLAVELPPGSRLGDTQALSEKLSESIAGDENVSGVLVIGGTILGSGSEVRTATVIIKLKRSNERDVTLADFKRDLATRLGEIADARTWFLQDNGQRPLQVVVLGRDGDAVDEIGARLAAEMREVPELRNVISSAALERPELRVYPKNSIAAELGVTTAAISETVRIATIGDVSSNLARIEIGDRQIPIRVELKDGARGDRKTLETLHVMTNAGDSVPLTTVASFKMAQGATAITRYDRKRRVMIGADIAKGTALGAAVTGVLSLPSAKDLPVGISVREFGDSEIMKEVFESFGKAMMAGLLCVYAVLVLLFGRFLQPMTILLSLPLSIGGAIVGLALMGQAISLPVVIGVLMLMGIVTKNAIMLVDFAIERIERGIPTADAVIDAGRKRARPIIMTTIAMVAGMLPSALGIGSGGEFRSPMAIAVIGGLISSTLLSLVFVPAVFAAVEDSGRAIWGRFDGLLGSPDEARVSREV